MRQRGRIKFFKPERGYGFIVPDNDAPDVLLHVTVCDRCGYEPGHGDSVFFTAEQHMNGMRATWVEKAP